MDKAVHFFSRNKYVKNSKIWERFGIRGKQAMEFAALNLPIVPGFILDSQIAAHLDNFELAAELPELITQFEKETGKTFDDPKNPLLLKVVISPNLAIVHYPTLHNFGLTDATLSGFADYVGEQFGYHEILFLMHGIFQVEKKIAELNENAQNIKLYSNKIAELDSVLNAESSTAKLKKKLEEMRGLLPGDFFTNAYSQLEYCLRRISTLLNLDELDNEDAALIVQPMVYGNYGSDSGSGEYTTRNPVTGEGTIHGLYVPDTFNSEDRKGQDVATLSPKYVKELDKTARTVEDHFMEIRSIRFTIENKKLWFVDQRPLVTKSTQADIQLLLDLHKRKKIDDSFLIHALKPDQLNEILHPVIHPESVKNFTDISGGIAGAPGAAIGRVYFTTDSLLEAYRNAQQQNEDTRMILCMPATFADDVKAIEVATGVLSSEGGYSAHASVVSRQYGKVSLVQKNLKFPSSKSAKIGQHTLKEGDLITVQVPHYGDPHVYLGEAELIEPDPKDSGLLDFVQLIKKHVKDFHVRVNADTARDSQLAVSFGAEGIGLCRTEHMFFKEERINVFRQMILSENEEDRRKVLTKLKKMQKDDFYHIFKAMDGKEVTIRLLDAPLHEFLPHNKSQTKTFVNYMQNDAGIKITEKQVNELAESLQEFNPMLGHRGCRIAVSYPEIYEMQVEAIFEAAFKARKDGIKVYPEIMIPLIMNSDELKLIIFGKRIEGKDYKGLSGIEAEVRKKLKEKTKMEHHFGTMIELPVAALAAGDIARYAEFFSFGTNDLTQTTIGLSRDDYTSFMPDYTLFDIIPGNPFQELDPYVKELISTAARRGKMTRPGLSTGLCGEHGAIPQNISFCMDAGLDYVSCSVYSVPIALLAVAQEVVPSTGSR